MPRRPSLSPSVRRRRLAYELRKLRVSTGKHGNTVAKELGWQPSKISRIEKPEQGINQGDLERLLDLYKIDTGRYRDALMQLAKDATERGWWTDFRDVFGPGALPDFEAEAHVIRTFEPQAVPGLLETPAYIEASFRGGAAHTKDIVDRHVAARLERQRILEGVHPAKLKAIIDEGALRRMVGGHEVMREQLQHLINQATRHNIDINVLPFAGGAHASMLGGFTLLDFPDPQDRAVAFIESVTSSLILEESHQMERCNDIFAHLLGAALPADQSVEFVQHVMDEIPI